MTISSSDRNPVDRLAEEFAERLRRGERPSLTEYVERYAEHADEIRELFPALVMMEQLNPASTDLTGDYDGDATDAAAVRPERLGDYRILREVGHGGMGVVYEAEQVSLGRYVALKVLPGQALLNPTHLERFRREAKAAAKLHHTNIVPVYGVGEANGVHFYAMQFIRGEGLDRILNDLRRLRHEPSAVSQGSIAAGLLSGQFSAPAAVGQAPPLPEPTIRTPTSSSSLSGGPTEAEYPRSVARLALQVADALAYAHRQGVLHRDIKPSNLLLDAQGAVWVTDFGLAKAEGADELTNTGDIVGTVRFMAPERFEGRSLPQSDMYALGLTLYELLTLRPAFDDTNKAKLIEQVLHDAPLPLRKIDAHVPRDLETVVLKCLAKEPGERYATAEALAEDLRRFLADRPVKARRASNAERLWRWCRRNPAVASLTAVALILLIAVAIVASVSAIWLGAERDRVVGANRDLKTQYEKTEEERGRADDEWKRAEKAERATRDRLWEAKLAEARALRMSRQLGQRFASLRAIREAMQLPVPEGHSLNELRTEAIAALCLPDFEVAKEWDGCLPGSVGFTIDPEFQRYARSDKDGNVSVRRIEGDEELFALPGVGPSTAYDGLLFSPDGRFLHVLSTEWFSPDGKWLVTNGGGHRIWEVGTWKEGPSIGSPSLPRGCAFTADSKLMALGAEPGVVRLVDPATGREVARLTAPEPTRLWPHCFTPDGGQLIAVGGETQAVHVFDLRAIRAGLREIGLDWSDDPLPPTAARPEPLRLTVEGGPTRDRVEAQRLDNLARGHIAKNEFAQALVLLRRAIWSDPDLAPTHNNLAWVLVAGPVKLRDAKEALPVAERAVKLAPDEWFYLNTLGVAQYRNGLHKEAVLTLEKSLSRSGGEFDTFDLLFLAMCHAKLGDSGKAKDFFERAVKSVEAKKNLSAQYVEELKAFRAEAEEALRKE